MIYSRISHKLIWAMGMTLVVLLAAADAAEAVSIATVAPDGTPDANVGKSVTKRDPFWPVDYAPNVVETKETALQGSTVTKTTAGTDWNKAMEKISIQGVSSRAGNEFFAVVNGEIKSTGENVSVWMDGVHYIWVIDSISPPSSLKLRRVSAGSAGEFQ